jgi:uncharacterized protein
VSTSAWLLGSVALLVGASVQSIVGFGMNLISVPFLLLVGRGELVPAPLIAVLFVQALVLGLGEVSDADWALLTWFLPVRLVGTGVGILVGGAVAATTSTVIICVLVLAGVGLSMSGWRVPANPVGWGATGWFSGFSNALSSIGGPPLALAMTDHSPAAQRATQGWSAAVGSVMSMTLLSFDGRFDGSDIRAGALLVPAALLGTFAVRPLRPRLPTPESMRPWVWGVAIIGSVAALVRVVV